MRLIYKLFFPIIFINVIFISFCTTASAQQDISAAKNAYFSKTYSDFGTDTNRNGLYDIITINVGIIVPSPGEYAISGSLYSVSGNESINVTKKTYLSFGAKIVGLDFRGSKVAGVHYLKNLTLYDSHGDLLDKIDNAYVTKNDYNLIENGPLMQAKLIGNYTEHRADVNGDGLYDYLIIDAGVDVTVPAEYGLMGDLYDSNNEEVAWAIDHKVLSRGNNTMHLNFDGKSINNHRVNGPYYLGNITLFSGSSPTGIRICDFLQRAYNTSAYNYSEFGT
ncbi:MAG: hypothetical protein WB392_14120 [Methanotrichaceae archaeon]